MLFYISHQEANITFSPHSATSSLYQQRKPFKPRILILKPPITKRRHPFHPPTTKLDTPVLSRLSERTHKNTLDAILLLDLPDEITLSRRQHFSWSAIL